MTSAPPRSNALAANAAAALAAVLFGAAVVAVRLAVRDVPPLTLALCRFGLGTAVLFVGLLFVRGDLLRVERRDLPYLAMLGVIFYAIFPFTFNAGMQYVPASRGALLLATMPVWTLLLGRAFAGDRLVPRQVLGVGISLAGIGIVLAERGALGASGSTTGTTLLLVTALCGAIYNLLARRMTRRYSGVTITFYAMLFGSILLLPSPIIERAPALGALSANTLGLLVFLGVFGGALGFSLWTAALRQLSPTQVSVYINLNPLSATALGALVLHERLSAGFVAGFLTVAVGVVMVNWTRVHKKPIGTDSILNRRGAQTP